MQSDHPTTVYDVIRVDELRTTRAVNGKVITGALPAGVVVATHLVRATADLHAARCTKRFGVRYRVEARAEGGAQ